MPNPSQPFRLGSDGQVHHLEVFEESQTKHQVVFWDDITRVFPKVLHVKNGHTIVSLARNQQHQWCEPRCIRYYPGVTLEVIEGDCPDTQATPIPTNTLAIAPRSSASFESTDPLQTVESLVILDAATVISPFIATTLSSSANETLFATPTTPPHRLLQRTQSVLQESSAQMVRYERSVKAGQLVQADSIMYGMQAMLKNIQGEFRALHSEVAKNDELRALTQKIQDLEAAAKAQAKRMEEMHKQSVELQERSLKMQQEALDRLAQIQSKVAAILTQNYELHEYPIPRLFIVLPKEDITRTEMLTRGVRSLLAKQFKLYFLCECGDHTKPADGQPQNCNLKHEIHRALHDGYDIDRPTEFFEKYGSYILTLLQMIKYGVTIAGVVVPPLGQLKVVDSLENVAEGIDHVLKDIGPKVDSSIAYIESLMGTQSQLSSPDSGALSTMEALEGADLRQLESFLKSSDEGRVLGNLYRIVTSEGHVKWVCLDHYRENYRVKAVEDFRDALKEFDGVYIEATGSVQVLLRSPVAARKFYSALSSSRSVQELSIGLLWGYTLQELRELRDTVKSTNLLHLRIQGDHQDSPLSDFLNNGRRSDPILQMMSGGKVQSLQLDNWEGFLDRIGTIPTTLHVRKLEICSKERWFKGASRLVEVLRASPLLTELTCWGDGLGFTMDPVITALENSKLAQGLKLKMGSADYRHTYSDCPGALVQYEPGTSKILSFDLRVSRMEELELVHHPSVQNIYFTIRDGLTALQENLQRRFEVNNILKSVVIVCSKTAFSLACLVELQRLFVLYPHQTTRVQIELGYINGYHLETRRLSHVQDNYIINIQKLSLELRVNTTTTGACLQFLEAPSAQVRLQQLDIHLDDESDLDRLPALHGALRSYCALRDTRVSLFLKDIDRNALFRHSSTLKDSLWSILRDYPNEISIRGELPSQSCPSSQSSISAGLYRPFDYLILESLDFPTDQKLSYILRMAERIQTDPASRDRDLGVDAYSSSLTAAFTKVETGTPRRLRNLTFEHSQLSHMQWLQVVQTLDVLTMKRFYVHKSAEFVDEHLGVLVYRCISTAARLYALEKSLESTSGSISSLPVNEQLALQDLKARSYQPFVIFLNYCGITESFTRNAMERLKSSNIGWVQFTYTMNAESSFSYTDVFSAFYGNN